MDKLKQVLRSKIEAFSRRIPEQGNRTVNGKQKRLKFLIDNLDEFQKEINQIVLKFSKVNDLHEDDLKELQNFSRESFKMVLEKV